MGILDWIRRGESEAPDPAPEQAVLIRIPLSDDEYGTEDERIAIHALADRIDAAIRDSGAGEYDGDELGDGRCTLYMYGPDADALWASIEEAVRSASFLGGGHVLKRYGGPEVDTPSERVDL